MLYYTSGWPGNAKVHTILQITKTKLHIHIKLNWLEESSRYYF